MSGTGGKVALVEHDDPLGCNGGIDTLPPAQLALIVDLVGWDGANFYEGTAGSGDRPNSTAVLPHSSNGCTDTDNNAADFTRRRRRRPRNTTSRP